MPASQGKHVTMGLEGQRWVAQLGSCPGQGGWRLTSDREGTACEGKSLHHLTRLSDGATTVTLAEYYCVSALCAGEAYS